MVDIEFVNGIERPSLFPRNAQKVIQRSGLKHRFAVVQNSFVKGHPDMYFDEALWRRLIEFAANYAPDAKVTVTDWRKTEETALDDFMSCWDERADEERCRPPAFVTVRYDQQVKLLMLTEYWVDVGGPIPYADSYTYSLFSARAIDSDVIRFLSDAAFASQWRLATNIHSAS